MEKQLINNTTDFSQNTGYNDIEEVEIYQILN